MIANERIVHTGIVNDSSSGLIDLSIHVTDKMKPYGKLVAYYFKDDFWNADALNFEVTDGSKKFRNQVKYNCYRDLF